MRINRCTVISIKFCYTYSKAFFYPMVSINVCFVHQSFASTLQTVLFSCSMCACMAYTLPSRIQMVSMESSSVHTRFFIKFNTHSKNEWILCSPGWICVVPCNELLIIIIVYARSSMRCKTAHETSSKINLQKESKPKIQHHKIHSS
jgi:hypothetical protein